MFGRTLTACSIFLIFAIPVRADVPSGRVVKDSTALLAVASATPPTAASTQALQQQPAGFTSWPTLTGTWGGARPAMESAGLTFSAMYRSDQISNISGGQEARGVSINQLDLQLAIDGDAAIGIHGLALFAHVIANNGSSVSRWVGDAQIVSNLESTRLAKLYQFWVRQSFLDDHASVLAGLYDLNAEFYANDAAGLFLNSSFGVGKELAQAGLNGPGIYPNPALTLRLRGEWDGYYTQAAVLDGHPGVPEDPFVPSFAWTKDEGVLIIAEAGRVSDGSEGGFCSKFSVGAWWMPSSPEMPLPNGGAYLIAEQQLYREDGANQGLTLFSRMGVADLRVNRFRANLSGGAVYVGPIPGRNDDKLGLGITLAQRNELLDGDDATALFQRSGEISVELSYRIQLMASVAIQPDLQYVIGPGCAPEIDNASVFGVRFEGHF